MTQTQKVPINPPVEFWHGIHDIREEALRRASNAQSNYPLHEWAEMVNVGVERSREARGWAVLAVGHIASPERVYDNPNGNWRCYNRLTRTFYFGATPLDAVLIAEAA